MVSTWITRKKPVYIKIITTVFTKVTAISVKNLAVLFLLINLFLKTILIHSTPPGATYDEIIYVGEAQSIVAYGTDLAGNWRPWHLEPSDSYYTELTSTVLVPGFILFPNDPILAGKFVPIILGSLLPILLALIAYRLKKSTTVFVATAMVATLNPWIFQFSRMGYDSLFSISFYLVGIVGLLYLTNWKKLITIIPFFLGFYQYQGHKVLLVPLIALVFIYVFFEQYKAADILQKFKKIITGTQLWSVMVVLIFATLLTTNYLIRLPGLSSSERISEFSFYDPQLLSTQVNELRQISLGSAITPLFINKYTVLGRMLASRFLNSFNPQTLFIEGNRAVDTFTVLDYGFFHLIDVFAIVLAIAFVIKNARDHKPLYFLILFICIGALPNVIRNGSPWLTFRGSFVFLGLVLLLGVGLGNFFEQVQSKYKLLFPTAYILLALPFFFLYFVSYPVTHTRYVGFYERVVASYINRTGIDSNFIIVPDRADATFNYLITYNNMLSSHDKAQINTAAQTKKFEISNTQIASACPIDIEDTADDTTVFVHITKKPCQANENEQTTTRIKSLIDAGLIFEVHNDSLCSQYELGRYPDIKKNILEVEKLNNQEFCQSFFSR